jgi:transmembrane 9 superfamily protein 3
MMVFFLIGLVAVILLRTLRRDFARYDKEEELGDLVGISNIHTLGQGVW